MFNGVQVIDVHGHMSAPPEFRAYGAYLHANRNPRRQLDLSDESLENAQQRHLRYIDERNIDFQVIGPRPVVYWHWMAPYLQDQWCRTTNDVIAQICRLHPDRFVGAAQLPQFKARDSREYVPELQRCVKELGFVAAYVNPDPYGDRDIPGMAHEYWYPLYEKAQDLDVPLIVHPAQTYDPRVDHIPENFQINSLTEEYIATMILEHSTVFETFPRLKIIVCHFGGALYRFIPTDSHHLSKKDLSNNLFFDTCAYDVDFLRAAFKQKGVPQSVFGTEAPGSGQAVRPESGKTSDDLVPIIDSIEFLSNEDKIDVFHNNPKKSVPLLANVPAVNDKVAT